MASAALILAFSALAQDASPAPDRPDPTLTPIEQGDNKADLTTTARIRKELLRASRMSVNAHNVKIITNAGKVTLRGPVDTAEEKRLIGEIAVRYALPGHVDNQLEVKL
jgi:osmotically-inducible protein OsmY